MISQRKKNADIDNDFVDFMADTAPGLEILIHCARESAFSESSSVTLLCLTVENPCSGS